MFTPGSQIEISFEIPYPGYSYGCSSFPLLSTEDFTFGTETFPLGVGAGLLGVFSGSDALLLPPNTPTVRVPDAIDAGNDIVTPNSNTDGQPTDIPQDFQIFPHTDFTVVAPPNATHLFLGVGDSFFSDNCVPGNDDIPGYPSGAIIVTIGSSAKGLIEGAITELSATQEAIEASFGVGNSEEAVGSLDKAIARLDSSLLAFPEDDPCRLLEDCKVGKEFFRALQTAVAAIFEAIDGGGISDSVILDDLEGIVVGKILEAANIVAATAIQDAKDDVAADPNDIAQAEFRFAMAEQLTADGVSVGIAALMFFDEAVGSYKQAWRNVRKATGACGPLGGGRP